MLSNFLFGDTEQRNDFVWIRVFRDVVEKLGCHHEHLGVAHVVFELFWVVLVYSIDLILKIASFLRIETLKLPILLTKYADILIRVYSLNSFADNLVLVFMAVTDQHRVKRICHNIICFDYLYEINIIDNFLDLVVHFCRLEKAAGTSRVHPERWSFFCLISCIRFKEDFTIGRNTRYLFLWEEDKFVWITTEIFVEFKELFNLLVIRGICHYEHFAGLCLWFQFFHTFSDHLRLQELLHQNLYDCLGRMESNLN